MKAAGEVPGAVVLHYSAQQPPASAEGVEVGIVKPIERSVSEWPNGPADPPIVAP
jgi:hypothetical protein